MVLTKEERKEMVLRHAGEVFSEKGYHRAKISDIIQRAGIARGTFYLYFENKRDVFENILDHLLVRFGQIVRPISLGQGDPPPLEQLKRILRSLIELALEDKGQTQILLNRAGGLDTEFDQKLDEFYDILLQRIEAAIKHGTDLGLVRECEPRVAARCVLGCVKEIIDLISTDEHGAIEIEPILDELFTFGMRGLLTLRIS